MKKIKTISLIFFLLAILFFKLPNFYIFPIQNAFLTSQAISRVILILIFLIQIIVVLLTKRIIFKYKNQKLLIILITLFFFLQSISILQTINIASYISRYKDLIIGYICFLNFYFFRGEYRKILLVFLLSTIINNMYQFFLLFATHQTINIANSLLYQKHWQVVLQQLHLGKLQIDTYDEIILPFLFIFTKENKLLKSFSSSILILIIGFFSILSNYRTRFLMFIIGFFGSLFVIKKINNKVVLLLFLALFFIISISNIIALNNFRGSLIDRVILRNNESKQTITFRLNQIESAVDMGKANILGVGLGNYYDNLPGFVKTEKYLYPKKQINYIGAIGAIEFVHNIFGLIITETGYISLMLFCCILFMFIKNDVDLIKNGSDYQKSFVIAFWVLFLFGLFNPIIPGTYNVLFWGIRGMLV